MTQETILLVGFAFGLGVMLLSGLGFRAWQEGKQLESKLKVIEKENRERLAKAKKDKERGRRKRFEALLSMVLAFILLIAFLLFAGSVRLGN